MKSKMFCEECKNLPEGQVVMGHDHRNDYDYFIKYGRNVGFTDEQINFLSDWMEIKDGTETMCDEPLAETTESDTLE